VSGDRRHQEQSATATLKHRLQEAVGARTWSLEGEIARKLAKQDRQASLLRPTGKLRLPTRKFLR